MGIGKSPSALLHPIAKPARERALHGEAKGVDASATSLRLPAQPIGTSSASKHARAHVHGRLHLAHLGRRRAAGLPRFCRPVVDYEGIPCALARRPLATCRTLLYVLWTRRAPPCATGRGYRVTQTGWRPAAGAGAL